MSAATLLVLLVSLEEVGERAPGAKFNNCHARPGTSADSRLVSSSLTHVHGHLRRQQILWVPETSVVTHKVRSSGAELVPESDVRCRPWRSVGVPPVVRLESVVGVGRGAMR